MSEKPTWWLETDFDAPGWVLLPAIEDSESEFAEREWLDQVVSEVKDSWGDQWAFETSDPIRQALSRALHDQPGQSALGFVFVPPDIPLLAQAAIYISEAETIENWVQAGYYVSSYDSAKIGPGVQCLAQQKISGDGERLDLTRADYVFTDDAHAVVMSVEETETEVFVAMMPGLLQILDGIQISNPDGERFGSQPIKEHTTAGDGVWNLQVTGGAAAK